MELLHARFQFARLPFQITVILGGGDVPCFRATHTTLQTVFIHDFGVVVMVTYQLVTVQYIIGTQSGCIRFLSVGTLTLRLLLFCFPALSRYYRYDGGVYVRCSFIHVQNC